MIGVAALFGGPNAGRDSEPPPPPTAAEVRSAVEAFRGPVFWFGPRTEGEPLSSVDQHFGLGDWKTLTFTYGLDCEVVDATAGGPECTDEGTVSTANRRAISLSAPRASCWVRVGRAWLIDCQGQDVGWYGPRLLTGGRVVRFERAAPDDTERPRPWRRTIGQLQRHGRPGHGPAALPATTRATEAEFAALGPRAQRALPAALRPPR